MIFLSLILRTPFVRSSRRRELLEREFKITKNTNLEVDLNFNFDTLLEFTVNLRGTDYCGPMIEFRLMFIGLALRLHNRSQKDYDHDAWVLHSQ